ncbi:MAG TPA: SsrA-binding protein SmpB, partial [Chthoniobacteraceae bacterium]|nr:SsrA-binding protein SmpB [Chthoniobacteraceae bacterium]
PYRRIPRPMASEIITNRKALHDYHILEHIEAGVELKGTEVKSIRAGLANLSNAFARVEKGEVFLYDADIQPYVRASHEQHESKRRRKLLLHKSEIAKLFALCSVKGHTLVALRLYWKDSRVKLEIGVGKGKEAGDKRQDLKAKATKRETDREISRFNKKHG